MWVQTPVMNVTAESALFRITSFPAFSGGSKVHEDGKKKDKRKRKQFFHSIPPPLSVPYGN
jgi:hypothetical protein